MSGKSVMIHDSRLKGRYVFHGYDAVRRVNAHTPLRWAFQRVRNYVRHHGKLDTIGIACHGYEDTVINIRERISQTIGGFGLELCREGLFLSNVSTASILRNRAKKIIIYACSTADQHPDTNHPAYMNEYIDGQRLLMELAHYTNTRVYAADATQYSDPISGGRYDLGRWYGNVYEALPDGRPPEIIQSYPRR